MNGPGSQLYLLFLSPDVIRGICSADLPPLGILLLVRPFTHYYSAHAAGRERVAELISRVN